MIDAALVENLWASFVLNLKLKSGTRAELGGREGAIAPLDLTQTHTPLNIYLPILSLCMFLFALSLYSATLHVILCYGAITFGSTCNVIFLANDYQEAHYIPLKISFLVIIALT